MSRRTELRRPVAEPSYSLNRILRSARATLGLSPKEIVHGLSARCLPMSHSSWSIYEQSAEKCEQMSANRWVSICHALQIDVDKVVHGYDYEDHLRRIGKAIEQGCFPFRVTDHLDDQLRLLERLERARLDRSRENPPLAIH